MQGFSRVRLHSFGKKLLIILKLNDGADVVVGVLVDVDADADVDVEDAGVDTITSSTNGLTAFLLIKYACADQ